MKKVNFNIYCLWLSLVFSSATFPMQDRDFLKHRIEPIKDNKAALQLLYRNLSQQRNELGWSLDSDDAMQAHFLEKNMSQVSAALRSLPKDQSSNLSMQQSVNFGDSYITSMLSDILPIKQAACMKHQLAQISTNEAALKQLRTNLAQKKSIIFCTDYDFPVDEARERAVVDEQIRQVDSVLRDFYANQPK